MHYSNILLSENNTNTEKYQQYASVHKYLSAFVFDFIASVIRWCRRCHRVSSSWLWPEMNNDRKKWVSFQMEAMKQRNAHFVVFGLDCEWRGSWNKYLWRMKIVSLRKMAAWQSLLVTSSWPWHSVTSSTFDVWLLYFIIFYSIIFCRISGAVVSAERLIYLHRFVSLPPSCGHLHGFFVNSTEC